jgi:hypothetical protein
MKPCTAYKFEVFTDFVAERLAGDEAAALRRHLAACPACAQSVARLTRLWAAMERAEDFREPQVLELDHQRIMRGAADLLAGRAPETQEASRRGVVGRLFQNKKLLRALAMGAAAVFILGSAIFLEYQARKSVGTQIARTVALQGHVYLEGRDAPLRANEQFQVGQGVRTARQARLTLKIADGAAIELNESSAFHFDFADAARTACVLPQGEAYVDLASSSAGGVLEIRTPSAVVQTSGAKFDLKVSPRSFARRDSWAGGLVTLAVAAAPAVLGAVGPQAEVELTVLEGEVSFSWQGESQPVKAGEQLRYDPAAVKPEVRPVQAERYVLWRLPDEDVSRLAKDHLAELFAAKAAALPGGRVQLDYAFETTKELSDWRLSGNEWTVLHNALRARPPQGGQSQIESGVPWIGDVQVSFDVTVDSQRRSTVAWLLRPAGEQLKAAVTISANANVAREGTLQVALAVDDQAATTREARWPGPEFRMGGRLDKGMAYVTLQDADVLTAALPDEVSRRLYDASNPQAMRVILQASGPEVFIGQVTLLGRPDPQWLRGALQKLFSDLDRQGR